MATLVKSSDRLPGAGKEVVMMWFDGQTMWRGDIIKELQNIQPDQYHTLLWLDESPTPDTVQEDFKLLEEYDMKDKPEKTIEHCLTKMPEENRKKFITNLCNGMIGSAILHFNNRYVKKLNVPDFKTTFK